MPDRAHVATVAVVMCAALASLYGCERPAAPRANGDPGKDAGAAPGADGGLDAGADGGGDTDADADGDGDTDADGDGDADADGDTDTDADSDSDTDTDSVSDTGSMDGDADADGDGDADADADADADTDADTDADECLPPECSFPDCYAYTCDAVACPPGPYVSDMSDTCGPTTSCDPYVLTTAGEGSQMFFLPSLEDLDCPDGFCASWELLPPLQVQFSGVVIAGTTARISVGGASRVLIHDSGYNCSTAWVLGQICIEAGDSNEGWRVLAAAGAEPAWLRVDKCSWDDPGCYLEPCP